jgi:UDP-N-acetyl-2-amino-2-deoxyglucuronate dehydrogenase
MRKLNCGIAGCGDIAGYTALLSQLVPQIRLFACCDIDQEQAQMFAKRHRILNAYTEYNEMLANPALDVVYLAVPHNLHYAMILDAVAASKHVLAEKPLTRTMEEGTKLLGQTANHKVGVNYQYRYDRGCYALARAVQAGELGKIHSIRINIPWHRTRAYFTESAWHKTIAKSGGGTLITQGSHMLDVALWAVGEKPVSAMGYTATPGFDVEVDTLTQGIVETSGGTLINISSSMVAATEQPLSLEVYGESGTAIYRNLPVPSIKFIGVKVHKQRPPEWGVHALHRSLAGYAKWVLEDKPYLIPAHESLPVLAAVGGIYRSAQSGKREKITRGTDDGENQ